MRWPAAPKTLGIATLWAGEHVVMVDDPESRYPYSDDGRIAIPADADWLDPLVALSFAAAATSPIRLATGILLLAEHNPVLLAKQTASIDVLSGGRLSLGIGVGWSAEEFAALGVPFAGRGGAWTSTSPCCARSGATTWPASTASIVNFDAVHLHPKPLQDRRIPIVIGGNGDAALRRAARTGDGWYGFYLSYDETAERLATLRRFCEEQQRDPATLRTAVALLDVTADRPRADRSARARRAGSRRRSTRKRPTPCRLGFRASPPAGLPMTAAKIMLITGGTRGLGHEAARRLHEAGHRVYIGARDPEAGANVAAELGVEWVQLDVTDDASVRAAAAEIERREGRLDVLINNAGIPGPYHAAARHHERRRPRRLRRQRLRHRARDP